MSPSDKLYALALMLGGLGVLVALVRWEEVADHLVSALKVLALKRADPRGQVQAAPGGTVADRGQARVSRTRSLSPSS
jgi:hypothetical protein